MGANVFQRTFPRPLAGRIVVRKRPHAQSILGKSCVKWKLKSISCSISQFISQQLYDCLWTVVLIVWNLNILPKKEHFCCLSFYLLGEPHHLQGFSIFLDSYLVLQLLYTDSSTSAPSYVLFLCLEKFSTICSLGKILFLISKQILSPLYDLGNYINRM